MDLVIRSGPDAAAASELFGIAEEELTVRFPDASLRGWWSAYDEHAKLAGVAVASTMAEGCTSIVYRVAVASAFAVLVEHALGSVPGPVHLTVDAKQDGQILTARELGFDVVLSSVKFNVAFDATLAALPPRRRPNQLRIATADEVDIDNLFGLDTELRRDVPGTEHWAPNRARFDDELNSDGFDPSGYRVAVDTTSGDLVGLCRMWRNPTGPKLGLLGVRRRHRNGFLATDLLRTTLTAASTWGWPTFEVDTARAGLQRHLRRVGAQPAGGYVRCVHP